MENNFAIRKCEEKDLADVIQLMEQLSEVASGGEGFALEQVKIMHREMEHFPEIYLNLVYENENHVMGFISIIFYKTFFHSGGTTLINELIVDKNMRGLGIGRQLVECAILKGKGRGMDEIEVSTEKSNLAALRFYHQAGFNEEFVLLGMEF